MSSPLAKEAAARSVAPGYAAILCAVGVWGGWIVATRHGVAGVAGPLDLALLRYVAPVALLAPIWLRKGLLPKGESAVVLAIMALGWGGPFALLTGKGLETVEAGLFGPLVPGFLPIIVAAWDRLAEGRRLSRARRIGVGLIAISALLVILPAATFGDGGVLAGAPYLLAAALGWAAFTIAYRRSALTGLEATAYVCLWSSPLLIGAALLWGTNFSAFTLGDMAWHGLVQGVLAGIGAVASFGYAVRRIGAARASSFTALVPVVAALGGWAALGEDVGALGWLSVAAACAGVACVNGAFGGMGERPDRVEGGPV